MSDRLVHIYIENLPKFSTISDLYKIMSSDDLVAWGSPKPVKFKLRGVQRQRQSMSFSTWEPLSVIRRKVGDFRRSGVNLNLVERSFDKVYFVEGTASKSREDSVEDLRGAISLRNNILGNSSLTKEEIKGMGVNDTRFGRAVRARVGQAPQRDTARKKVKIEDAIDLFSGELQASKWDKNGYVVYNKELSAVCFISPKVAEDFLLNKSFVGREIAFSAVAQETKKGKSRLDVDFVHVRPANL